MKTVLVIEDNDNNMELISFILENNSYRVVQAESGKTGFDYATKNKLDLIILDIQLPDIDGIQVLINLRAAGVETPIIAMTSYAMAGDREKLLAAGCTGYIEKPIDPERVVSQIDEIVGAIA